MQAPSVGQIVHYVSFGTPGGEYPSVCRAAVITEVKENGDCVGLAVLNPTGMFFNQHICQDEDSRAGGTWHWPERVPASSEPSVLESAKLIAAAYRERAQLVAYLARIHDAHWAADAAEPDWPVICIHTAVGQLSWHVSQTDMGLFPPGLEKRPSDWDGHSTEEKYARLAQLGA
ncbi:hypothetical protein [Parafrankia sp. EUN1f]|uniref:hypothetical protein n=1 Tax=Parafrankia sp. EUN1f TaxID=102897 RepID=UPI0001C4569B|nr:hypothetical protein [Parafrankia sp. EUN1f]EFC78882.1 hypothetical protein FrEUN1fDRAFT_7997 [Parafrankia sp. EUN1f]